MKNQDISELPSMRDDALQLHAMQSHLVLEGVKPIVKKGKSAPWTDPDMMLCINDIYDMCEKTLINFLALDDFARAIREHRDTIIEDHVEIGMTAKALTPEIKSLFKTWGFEEAKHGYTYYFSPPIKWDIKIPVEIHVISKRYKFFDNPDKGWFGVNDFYLPNPFADYWKIRQLI